jgi:hypothetical protein
MGSAYLSAAAFHRRLRQAAFVPNDGLDGAIAHRPPCRIGDRQVTELLGKEPNRVLLVFVVESCAEFQQYVQSNGAAYKTWPRDLRARLSKVEQFALHFM